MMDDTGEKEKIEKNVSSGQMTCVWRCDEPSLSSDDLSVLMATPEGVRKARQFQKDEYQCAPRHFSLRAGFFNREAQRLFADNDYDSVISLGSGFSLLTLCIYHSLGCPENFKALDSDMEYMLSARKERILEIESKLEKYDHKKFLETVFDIEKMCKKATAENIAFVNLFPENFKKPIFLLEGITYFLSVECMNWLFEGIKSSYSHSAAIIDYWPSDAPQRCSFFENVFQYFKKNLPEDIECLLSPDDLERHSDGFKVLCDYDLGEAEATFMEEAKCELVDSNKYFPARLRVISK